MNLAIRILSLDSRLLNARLYRQNLIVPFVPDTGIGPNTNTIDRIPPCVYSESHCYELYSLGHGLQCLGRLSLLSFVGQYNAYQLLD